MVLGDILLNAIGEVSDREIGPCNPGAFCLTIYKSRKLYRYGDSLVAELSLSESRTLLVTATIAQVT